MKKLNKKGFTIVELVIVIAVIAILAAVLIPTFSTVIKNANKSAVLQEGRTAMDLVMLNEGKQGRDLTGKVFYIYKGDDAKFACKYDASATGSDPYVVIDKSDVPSGTTAYSFGDDTESAAEVANLTIVYTSSTPAAPTAAPSTSPEA